MAKKKEVVKRNSGQETSDVKMIEIEEINYNLDSDPELEANSELIKYEFNMIELPFFTKDKNVGDGKAKKYIFSEKDKSYMKITPSGDTDLISNKIPQEFDEKIFYGILKLSREQESKTVITDYFTLAKVSGVHYNDMKRIKDSIQRLRNCKIEMNNLFYNATIKGKMDGNQDFNILQDKEEYTFKEMQKLPEEKKEHYRKYFRNSKISEILVMTLADKVYKNIEHKGFLYFNQKELLEINNATARKLFLLITKWQGWEKKLSIKRSCRFLASRIPLSWEKTNIPGTINVIESAVNQLKSKNLINNFILSRTKPLSNSYIEFYFNDASGGRLYDYNYKAAGVTTGHEGLVINAVTDEFLDERQTTLFSDMTEEQFDGTMRLLPEQYRTEVNADLLRAFSSKGKEYLITSIEYAKKNYKENFDAYLRMTLEKDWAKGEREKQGLEIKKEKEEKQKSADDSERLRQSAEHIYNKMKSPELEKMHQEAERSSYYRFVLKDKVEKEEMTLDDALKEASIVLISGRIDKKQNP
jgi:hypothetical protein